MKNKNTLLNYYIILRFNILFLKIFFIFKNKKNIYNIKYKKITIWDNMEFTINALKIHFYFYIGIEN